MGSEQRGGRGMPQMAVGDKERLLGRDVGDEELMCSGLTARRASLTTSHSLSMRTRPSPLPPSIQAATFRGTFPLARSTPLQALFWSSAIWLQNLRLDPIRSQTLFDTSLDRKCVHIQFLFFHPTSTWVTTRLGKHRESGLLPSFTAQKLEYKNQMHTETHTLTQLQWCSHTSMVICFNVYWHRCMQRPSPPLWWCQIRKPGEREEGSWWKRNAGRWRWLFFTCTTCNPKGEKNTHTFSIPAWALFLNDSHSRALSIRTWPRTSLWTSQLSVCLGLTLVPLSAAVCVLQSSCLDSSSDVLTPTMRGLLIAVKL